MRPCKYKYSDKCFKQSTHCTDHELTHTGEKPYKCKICDKCFNRLSNCKRREITRKAVKPYKCKYCEKCFNNRPVSRGVHGVGSHPPTGPKGPHFDTQYPSYGVQSVKLKFQT